MDRSPSSAAGNPALLNQFSAQKEAPVDLAVMTDDAVLQQLVSDYGPASAMLAIRQAAEKTGGDCHDRAHELGRMSFELFGNPVFKLSLPECHSGFYHGSIEAFFAKNGTAHLEENLATICDSDLNAFFTHQCLHGIGHGLMAWSDYGLPDALEYCHLIPANTGKSSCRSGVFMENIVGGLSDSAQAKQRGHVSKFLNNDPHFPCTIVKDEYKADCYFLQTDRMLALAQDNFEEVARNCESAPAAYQESCFGSMGRTVGGRSRGDPKGAIARCDFAQSNDHRIICILGAAQDTFWDKNGRQHALDFCEEVPETEGKAKCYALILNRAREILTIEDFQLFCTEVPSSHAATCSNAHS